MFGRRTNMADNSTPWASRWTVQFDPYSGYVNDESSADELIKQCEIATTTRFTVLNKQEDFQIAVGWVSKLTCKDLQNKPY